MQKQKNNFYVSRKKKLLKDFDKTIKNVKHIFLERYGDEKVSSFIKETRAEYERIIPLLPDVGVKQPFVQFVIGTGMSLAIYNILKKSGEQTEEIGKLIYLLSNHIMSSYPKIYYKILGGFYFSKKFIQNAQKGAIISKKKLHPESYVFNFIPGDGKAFDYGIDYLECASCKFLHQQKADELASYICPIDIIYSEKFGWGLKRTKTIADGNDICDFRFKRGGKT